MITKGKWKVNQEGNHFAIRSSEDLCPISETRHCTNIDRANAQLIAQAPYYFERCEKLEKINADLYEALKTTLRELTNRFTYDAADIIYDLAEVLAKVGASPLRGV